MADAREPEPTHLNNKHLDTLTALFEHPLGHNIQWPDVRSLLEAVGKVEERHDGRFRVHVGGATEVFDRPRHKDIDTQTVIELRRMLRDAGYGPRSGGAEV